MRADTPMHADDAFERALAIAFVDLANLAPVEVDPAGITETSMLAAASGPAIRRPSAVRWGRAGLLVAATLALLSTAIGLAVVGSRPIDLSTTDGINAPTIAPRRAYDGVFTTVGTIDSELAPDGFVRLADGRILILSESWPDRKQLQLFDPATAELSPAGLTVGKRSQAIGVLLLDGRVLILGGDTTEPVYADGGYSGSATYSTAELYDPATGTFTAAGSMVGKGWAPTAIRLADGRVLVLDGLSVDDADAADPTLATAEVYDPATNTFTATGPMSVGRGRAPMALLRDGRVIVLGGRFPEAGIVDLFDPATGRFTLTASLPPVGSPPDRRGSYWPEVGAGAVPLPDGRILVPGRRCQEIQSILEGRFPTAAAIFDPATESFTPSNPMPHCVETATPLPDGRVFLTSFWGATNWSGIYDPATDTVTETAPPPAGRYMDVVGLEDGRVLVVGGGVIQIFH